MENCPIGFFCVNMNTLLMIIVILFIIFSYLISKGKISLKLLEDYSDLVKAKEILLTDRKTIVNKLVSISDNNPSNNFNNINTEIIEANKEIKEPIIINNIYVDGTYKNNTETKVVSKEFERLVNPLLSPERSYENTYGLPINIPTRGIASSYQQIGTLNNGDRIVPLFGRPMWRGSNKWNFYTFSDQFHAIKLPVNYKGHDCLDDTVGCDELYTGDIVNIPQYSNTPFTVNMYKLDKPTYIPVL